MQQGEGRGWAERENCFNLSPLGTGFGNAQPFNARPEDAAVPGAASRGRAALAQRCAPVTQSLGIEAKRDKGGTETSAAHPSLDTRARTYTMEYGRRKLWEEAGWWTPEWGHSSVHGHGCAERRTLSGTGDKMALPARQSCQCQGFPKEKYSYHLSSSLSSRTLVLWSFLGGKSVFFFFFFYSHTIKKNQENASIRESDDYNNTLKKSH